MILQHLDLCHLHLLFKSLLPSMRKCPLVPSALAMLKTEPVRQALTHGMETRVDWSAFVHMPTPTAKPVAAFTRHTFAHSRAHMHCIIKERKDLTMTAVVHFRLMACQPHSSLSFFAQLYGRMHMHASR